jgi:DedD protein
MAFFKFRKGGDDSATAAPPESIEAMRKRARYRLVGAAVLVLLGVIGFPLLFDNQPRPIAVDIPIDIPDKNKVKPLAIPLAPPATPETSAAAPAPVPPKPAIAVPPERKQALATGKIDDKTSAPAAPVVSAAPKPAVTPDKPADKPAAKPDETAKAQALLDGKSDSQPEAKAVSKPEDKKAAAEERFVVQVGAFAEVTRAREARLKLEKAGLKTYTQVVETKDGRRIRVRVGPFASKAEVDKVAEKIKKLDLPAAILTL